MRFLYVVLEGYIGLYNGLGLSRIELDMSKCKNNICVISGPNGVGKSTIINALNLFPDSADNITPTLNGSKYIRFTDGENIFEIYITYPLDKKGSRTQTKASFKKNGEELNPNGNITSYKEIIFTEFDMDPNFITLSRISGRNRGIADKTPAERKKLISSLISSLDVYNSMYKNLNKKANIFKSYMNNFADKIQRVGDEQLLRSTLASLVVKEERLVSVIEDAKSQIVEARTIVSMNDPDGSMQSRYNSLIESIDDAKKKERNLYLELSKAQNKLSELSYAEQTMSNSDLLLDLLKRVDDIKSEIVFYDSQKVDALTNIQSLSVELDNLGIKIDKVKSEIDPALEENINLYKSQLESIESGINILGISDIDNISKNELDSMLLSVEHFVDMVDGLYSIMSINDFKLIEDYYKDPYDINDLIKENEFNITLLSDKLSDARSRLSEANRDKKSVSILSNRPNTCADDTCLFIKEAILTLSKYNNDIDKEIELLESDIKSIQNTIDKIKESIFILKNMINIVTKIGMITDIVKLNINNFNKFSVTLGISSEKAVIDRICKEDRFNELRNLSSILDISNSLIEYKSIKKVLDNLLTEYKIQSSSKSLLYEYESEYNSKLDKKNNLLDKIKTIDKNKEFSSQLLSKIQYNIECIENLNLLETDWHLAKQELSDIISESESIKSKFDSSLALLEKINDLDMVISNNRLELEPIMNQKKQIESNLLLLDSYKEEYLKYKEKYNFMDTLRKYASPTKEGIQTLFMSMYMDKTLDMVNQILSMIFNGQYKLLPYDIKEDRFSIPFIGNGLPVDDISSGSESQVCIMSMAINLVLADISSSKYDIISMDEIDGGLDHVNRYMFVDVLVKICDILRIGQLFLISHSVESALNNVDVILLSDSDEYMDQFANANIIYQFKRAS